MAKRWPSALSVFSKWPSWRTAVWRSSQTGIDTALEMLESSPALKILPLTIEIAREAPPLSPVLRDPADCLIVATARVHGLRLLTSDQRIVNSKLAQIVD